MNATLGHLAALLPADILARYFRLAGDKVLFVSGTDCHGTPIVNRAIDEGKTPNEIAKTYHELFTDNFKQLGFTHDLYNLTLDQRHYDITSQFFNQLYKNEFIFAKEETQLFCRRCNQFLVDRLV